MSSNTGTNPNFDIQLLETIERLGADVSLDGSVTQTCFCTCGTFVRGCYQDCKDL